MDPNTALTDIRQLVKQYNSDGDWHQLDADLLVDRIEALDKWITNGGFLPDDWKEV